MDPKNLVLTKNRKIKASIVDVWDAITAPEKLKISLFGCDVITSWEPGTEILFKGKFNDTDFIDKGTVIDFKSGVSYTYDYWSNFSGLPDVPENYSRIKYEIEKSDSYTLLTLTHSSFNTQDQYEHSDKNWDISLDALVNLIKDNKTNSF